MPHQIHHVELCHLFIRHVLAAPQLRETYTSCGEISNDITVVHLSGLHLSVCLQRNCSINNNYISVVVVSCEDAAAGLQR